MDTGAWSVQLQDDMPRWVLEDIDVRDHLWATIVVTPQHWRVGDLSDANLLSLARYSGVLLSMGEGRRSLHGKGLPWWLGEDGDGGHLHASTDFTHGAGDTLKLSTAFDDLIMTGPNGLTKGTISGPEVYYSINIEGGDTKREMLDTICLKSSQTTVWQITPGGVINVNQQSTLYPTATTPTAVFIAEGSREGAVDGIPSIISVDELDGSGVRNDVWVDWDDGYNSGRAQLSDPAGWANFSGGTGADCQVRFLMDWRPKRPKPPTERWRRVAAWQIQNETIANSLASRELSERSEVRNVMTVSVDEYDPWRFDISPGNWAYILEPDAKIQDLTKSVQYQGEVIHPDMGQIQQWTTPIQEGYGVYLRYWTGAAIAYYDLTEWVDWETDFTTIKVGHRDRFAPATSPKRMSKLKKKRIRQAARYAAGKLRTHALDERWSNPDNIRGYRQLHAPPPTRPNRRG